MTRAPDDPSHDPSAPAADETAARDRALLAILEGLPHYVLALDADRRIRYANRTRHDTSLDAVLGRRIDELAEPSMRPIVVSRLEHLLATGERVEWAAASDVDGGEYVVSAMPLRGEELRVLVVARDLTADPAIDPTLAADAPPASRLPELAAGMAHELNNALAVIATAAELARAQSSRGDGADEEIAWILEGTERAADVARRLLALAARRER